MVNVLYQRTCPQSLSMSAHGHKESESNLIAGHREQVAAVGAELHAGDDGRPESAELHVGVLFGPSRRVEQQLQIGRLAV